ncbi:UUP1 family membrane protein [Zophobihabitans entericus]|uniref:Inactive transglutaminase family protein n=1 Tax=Zophobihabitans entericus TaxID=1635327 RepID=A0A6G9IBS8_9GAMM|nr:UUP1 family membrane protein [Zophobihabitans entericus]QIQ21287.1 inactive transglutaminase family protein [Zophobihabitans entericus]
MRSLTLHLKVLITILVVLGLSITAYQIFVQKTPITENELDNLWTIDARVDFDVNGTKPVKAQLYIPAKSDDYAISDEIFLAKDYGQNIDQSPLGNRFVTWSARRVSGPQTLYYRVNITKRYTDEVAHSTKGTSWREPIVMKGADKLAADALINEIRQKSSNTTTFITTAINVINDTTNDNVNLLLGKSKTPENRVKTIEVLLSQAYIPIQQVHILHLTSSTSQTPELWIRSYIDTGRRAENSTSTGEWFYFNPTSGAMGLPEDAIVWWVGNEDVLTVDNGVRARVTFSMEQSELTAISLAKVAQEGNSLMEYSFYSLPISTQWAYQVMLMIPFGVLIILVLRNIVGVNTLGTFTPVLIALAFRETGLVFGLVFFSLIVSAGLSLRSYLEHLKLQMLPRLSVVLTFVVMLIIFAGLFSHKLGFDRGLSISLFPMVILTMTIERLSITWEERGASFALKVAIGTLITASIAYLVMDIRALKYFVFTFPAIMLLFIAFMLAMGRYRGYRLLELTRFKAMLK